jgi:hypothetical protein
MKLRKKNETATSKIFRNSNTASNKLTLNSKKTEYTLIGSQQRLNKILQTPKIIYGAHQIKRVRERTVL